MFVDGSCNPHALQELARASWGLVVTTEGGEVKGKISGPVLWPLEQTSAMAEWCALGGLAQLVQPDQTVGVWADYKSMVDEVGKGRRSLLNGELRCGGLGRYICTQPGFRGHHAPKQGQGPPAPR